MPLLTSPLRRAAAAMLISLVAIALISALRLADAQPLTVLLVAFAASAAIFGKVLREPTAG